MYLMMYNSGNEEHLMTFGYFSKLGYQNNIPLQ